MDIESPKILAIDYDYTLGELSLVQYIASNCGVNGVLPEKDIIKLLVSNAQPMRPNIKYFFEELLTLKKQNKIDKIVLFTANQQPWFALCILKLMLEANNIDNTLFDMFYTKHDIENYSDYKDISMNKWRKNLKIIDEDIKHIYLVDDCKYIVPENQQDHLLLIEPYNYPIIISEHIDTNSITLISPNQLVKKIREFECVEFMKYINEYSGLPIFSDKMTEKILNIYETSLKIFIQSLQDKESIVHFLDFNRCVLDCMAKEAPTDRELIDMFCSTMKLVKHQQENDKEFYRIITKIKEIYK